MVVDQRLELGAKHVGIEGLRHIGIGTTFDKTFDALLVHGIGSEHQDGDVAGVDLVLETTAAGNAIHHGHHHVTDDHIGHRSHGLADACQTILGGDDTILLTEQHLHVLAQVGIVVDDENDGLHFVFSDVVADDGIAQLGLYGGSIEMKEVRGG